MKTDVTWDLSDLYSGVDDPQIDKDLKKTLRLAQAFEKRYKGKIAIQGLTAKRLREAIEAFEEIGLAEAKPGAYASLLFSTNTTDPKRGALLQKVREEDSRTSTHLIFFDLEIGRIPAATFNHIIKDPLIRPYRHYLEHERALAKFRLSEPEEQILEEVANSGRRAFARLFTEVTTRVRFRIEMDGVEKEMTQSELLSLFYDPDRDVRRKAASSLTEGVKSVSHVVTFSFNTLLQEKLLLDRLRGFSYPEESRHIGNELSPKIVDAVVDVCVENYGTVAEYYGLKRKLLGLKELTHYDRYAPILQQTTEMEFGKARDIVLDAFGAFSPKVRDLTEPFFAQRWIDAVIAPGKSGGAYCAGITPDLHPYVFINYMGKPRDVMTLAHELGHGLHDCLASKQTLLNYYPTLPLAETASTFGEMLVFERLLRDLDSPRDKLALLCEKIEDMIATVFRQVAMYRFERDAHRKRRQEGEQPAEAYNELWQTNMQEMFKKSVKLGDEHAWWWLYIPHVFHSPFYVYAYSFGELLVLSLFARYKQEGKTFIDRYIELLASGGSERPDALLKRTMGINIADRAFWQGGVDIIRDRVREAKKLALAT